jgi:hypothetical protein
MYLFTSYVSFMLHINRKFTCKSKSEAFRRLYGVKCKIVPLDFDHCLKYKVIKLQRFGSWILLLSSGKKGHKAYLWGHLAELTPDLEHVRLDKSVNYAIDQVKRTDVHVYLPLYQRNL